MFEPRPAALSVTCTLVSILLLAGLLGLFGWRRR